MRAFLFLALFLCNLPVAWAETPRYKLSFEAFETLLKNYVREVPELARVWAIPAGERRGVYLGGGDLRNVMKALDQEILAAEAVGRAPEPAKAVSLLENMRKSADHDLWVPTREHPAGRMLGGWDVLDQDFYQASVTAGGPTIEKLRVSPDTIDDPYHALRDWYHGKLEFKLTDPAALIEASKRLMYENTHTVLALRFLRFSLDNPSFRVEPSTWEKITEIARREPHLPKQNWFIHKGLANLYLSADKDPVKTFDALGKSGLLENLTANGYHLQDISKYDPSLYNFELTGLYTTQILNSDLPNQTKVRAIGFLEPGQASLRLMYFTEFTFGPGYDEGLRALKKFVAQATSFDEVAELLLLEDFLPMKEWSSSYQDTVGRLKALLAEVPELKTLPDKNVEAKNTLKGILRMVKESEEGWTTLRPGGTKGVGCAPDFAKVGAGARVE